MSVDYDLLSHLFLMAYDGFVINRRLNDLRDIERLVETVCDMMIEPAIPVRLPGGRASPSKPRAARTKPKRQV